MNHNPKISVIMPSLNVAPYIRQCLDSVKNQTIKDIEILCVDAGSDDGTLEILREYESADPRIKVLLSDRKSYGYQMNLGMDAASGDYIGIVETDDWAELNMFEILWSTAEERHSDVVKSNYYWYYTKPEVDSKPFENLKGCPYNIPFSYSDTLRIFSTTPAIWSGIYRREMLIENGIRFNETPGASYQDTSFHFMVCTVAKSILLLDKYFLHYRKDNDNSSVNSAGKVYCVSDEMHYYESFLDLHPEHLKNLIRPYMALKYEKYRWNYSRLAPQHQWEFLSLIYFEFLAHRKNGYMDPSVFEESAWSAVNSIIDSPVRYFRDHCKKYCTRPTGNALPPPEICKENTASTPALSIIIPAYNVENYIAHTLDSILKQTFSDIEIICVDDGSTDNTLSILLQYADRDNRITVIHQVNMGQSSARNRALALAKGRYIQFLDSDDMLREDAAAFLVKTADEKQLDILYFDGQSVFESPELRIKYPYYVSAYQYKSGLSRPVSGIEYFCTALERKKYRASPCMGCYRRSFLVDNNITFLDGIIQEDNIFSFYCNMAAQRVFHTEEQFYLRLVRHGSTMISEKRFEHVYGFLTCAMSFEEKLKSLPYSDRLFTNIAVERRGLISQMKNAYQALADQPVCRSKLNPMELMRLDEMIQNPSGINAKNISGDIIYHRSYEIGLAITWLPRKLREIYRKIKSRLKSK